MQSPARTLSLAALTVLGLSPPEVVTVAADAGYDCVGLRLVPATPEDRQYPVVGNTPMVRDIKARLADRNLRLLDVEVFRLKPDTKVGAFLPVLETAANLGARHLLTTGQDSDANRLVETFAAFCDLAAPFGLTADLEFMPWTEISSLESAKTLITAAGRDNAGLLVDALHFARTGARIEELSEIPSRWLHYIQLCDAPAARPSTNEELIYQARQARLLPGEGELDLVSLLRAVPADLPISIEVPNAVLAQGIPAVERARRAAVAAREVIDRAFAVPAND